AGATTDVSGTEPAVSRRSATRCRSASTRRSAGCPSAWPSASANTSRFSNFFSLAAMASGSRLLTVPPGRLCLRRSPQAFGERGGAFRETLALSNSYVEARRRHGESELLDEIVSAKPQLDHTH